MALIEIQDEAKWALLTLVGDRIRQLEDRIIIDQARGMNGTGAEIQLRSMIALQASLNKQLQIVASTMDKMEAEVIARERGAARDARDWPEADRLRRLLIEGGWHVRDTTTGYELTQAR